MSLCAVTPVAARSFPPCRNAPVCGCVQVVCDHLFRYGRAACTALLLLEDTMEYFQCTKKNLNEKIKNLPLYEDEIKTRCPQPFLILMAVHTKRPVVP